MRVILFTMIFCFWSQIVLSDGCSSVSFTATASPNLICSIDFLGLSVQNTDCDYTQPYDYYWDFGDGSPIAYTTMNPSHQYQASGLYNVTFTWEGICHGSPTVCFTTQSVQITLPPPPPITSVVSNYNGFNISCFGENDGWISLSSLGSYTYEWQTSPVQYGNTINNLYAGPIDVLAILNGCPTQPIPFDLTQPTQITSTITSANNYNGYDISCFGASDGAVNLTNVLGSFPPYNYIWNNGYTTQNISDVTAGVYIVDITDVNSCTNSNSIELIEPQLLELTSSFAHDTCDRQVGMAEVVVTGGVIPYGYLWSNNQTTTIINNLYGGNYIVTITDANNCIISEQFYIDPDLIENPIAEFNVVPNFNMHHLYRQLDNPIFFIDKSIDKFTIITNWFWEFEDGFSSADQDTKHSFAEIGDFNVNLAIENLYGCIDTITKRVIVEEFLLYIPNSFTPQNDGINDIFLPKGIGIKDYELKIYSRWGEHFFTSNDLNIGWDGTLDRKDRIAQLGVYVYLINVTDVFGEKHTYRGQVTLIK